MTSNNRAKLKDILIGNSSTVMQAPSDDDLVKEYEENRRKFENEESEKSKFEKQSKLITSSLKHNLLQIRKGLATPSSLYDYQIDAVLKTADFFARSKPVPSEAPDMALIVAPPGSGKSGMVTLLPYVLSSKKVLILTPSQIISDQLAADFGRGEGTQPFFVKSGMFKRAECKKLLEPLFLARSTRDVVDYMEEGNLVIVNAQKFAGKAASSVSSKSSQRQIILDKLEQFDTIIVDEAHHYPAKTWEVIVNSFMGKNIVFLTATPYRGSDDKAFKLLGGLEVVYEIPRNRLEGENK